MNSINIVGRLTADPELKTTTNGKQVASFSVAVDNQGKDSGATFFRCQAWEKTAEFICNYLGKGRLVSVSGRMQSRSYQDKDGNKRESWELTASEVRGLDRPTESAATIKAPNPSPEDEYDPFKD